MRRSLFIGALSICSGCSLLYDGSDLRGKASHRPKFVSSSYQASDNGATDLAAGDFDGDGNLDIVQIETDDTSLLIFLGHGDGSFSPSTSQPTGCASPVAVTTADLDGDGKSDIILVCSDDNLGSGAAKLLASGGGGFLPAAKFSPGGDTPVAIAATDVNGDGNPDIIIVNQDSTGVALIRGTGMGNLATAETIATGDGPSGIALADIDGDKVDDAVVANFGSGAADNGTLAVLLAQNGTLHKTGEYPGGNQASFLALADFDGKNGPDIAVPDYGSQALDIILATGAGTYPATLPTAMPLTIAPNRVLAADLDGDGKMDVLVGGQVNPNVLIFYGEGDGKFDPVVALDTATPTGMIIADFDKDGRPDIAIGGDDMPGTLNILMNRR